MPEPTKLRLLTCVGVERDLPLLPHFLAYYRDLGVPTSNMHVILNATNANAPGLADAEAVLDAWGAADPVCWIGDYTSTGMWERRQALQRRVAGSTDWVISADVDEFHRYPAPLRETVAFLIQEGVTVLQGPFIDRVSETGALAEVSTERSLFEQFPVEGDVMIPVGKEPDADDAHGTVKMMLFRGDVLPGLGGHNPKAGSGQISYAYGMPLSFFPEIKTPAFRFRLPTSVLHFKWTAQLLGGLRKRLNTPGASRAGSVYGARVLDYLERNGRRIDLSDVPRRDGESQPQLDWRTRVRQLRSYGRERHRIQQGRSFFARPLPGPRPQPNWTVRQLTTGSDARRFHSHSYYDIYVLDPAQRRIATHRMSFAERWMTKDDVVDVGFVDAEQGGFTRIGESRAWSWQQGPMAQWVPGTARLAWNDRIGRNFVARVVDVDQGGLRTLPRPIYAIDPSGSFALSVNMARLDRARPGYGYKGGGAARLDLRRPADDGMWRMDLNTGTSELILSLDRAVEFLQSRLTARERKAHQETGYTYWFNHVKLSPDGSRFTVKLRWRKPHRGSPWTGLQGVSLTCGVDGRDLRLLAQATSHVMWWDPETLYFWQQSRKRLVLIKDRSPDGHPVHDIAPDLIGRNVHMRHVPDAPHLLLYDTPYEETVGIHLLDYRDKSGCDIAQFTNHVPNHGPFRCDLHPVPSPTGQRIVVTSLMDGGRQVYVIDADKPLA